MTMTFSRLDDCKLYFNHVVASDPANSEFRITCGLYINITLYDYVRTIINLTRSNTTWSLVSIFS